MIEGKTLTPNCTAEQTSREVVIIDMQSGLDTEWGEGGWEIVSPKSSSPHRYDRGIYLNKKSDNVHSPSTCL